MHRPALKAIARVVIGAMVFNADVGTPVATPSGPPTLK
jgi:hypothetical protein